MEKEQRGCKVGKEDKEDSVSGRCLVEPDSPWGILSHTMQTKVTDKGRRTTPRALEGPTLVLLQARPKASRSIILGGGRSLYSRRTHHKLYLDTYQSIRENTPKEEADMRKI